MAQGSNQVGLAQPVYLTNADGSASGGSQTSANSQSVTPASDSAPFPVVGNIAAGVADTGNPVRNGGTVRVATTNYADGQRAPFALTMNGALQVGGFSQFGIDLASSQTVSLWGQDGNPRPLAILNYVSPSSGASPVIARGDVTGTWSHNPASTASTALSGTIATSGGTAPIAMTNTTRTEVINPSTGTLWASWGTPAVNGAGSFPITAGSSYSPPDRSAGTLTLLSTAATQPYTVNRFS